MFITLPDIHDFSNLPWSDIQKHIDTLLEVPLSPENIEPWLSDLTGLEELLQERSARTRIATVQDTTDRNAEERYKHFLSHIFPSMQLGTQKLKQKLLAYADHYGEPAGLEVPMRGMRVDAALFREENLPLKSAEQENGIQLNKIIGAQTVLWAAEEQTITALAATYNAADRSERQQMWELVTECELADRQAINKLWREVLDLRLQQARNTGFGDDYRAYRWQLLNRFDYSPEDSQTFQDAIEKTAVPAAGKIYEKYRRLFGVETLRPWDLDLYQQTYPISVSNIMAFKGEDELLDRGSNIFHRVSPKLGAYFDQMRESGMIDFANRKGKGPGAFCTTYGASKTPFIFGNTVGNVEDVRTLLHEAGHAFHGFEKFNLPYHHQRWAPMEFNEVASTAMEMLASPYLSRETGGYFEKMDYVRSQVRQIEKYILFWPYMAVVDRFQHWVYENPQQALKAVNCDAAWDETWDRFIPWIDWSGLDDVKSLGWHRKRHIHRAPFYYIEYGLAQLGAVQIWAKALQNQEAAVESYLGALALGGTASLPDLYAAAGGNFALDDETVGEAVILLMRVYGDLEAELAAAGVRGSR